jgi:hypothetical protein
MGDIDRRGDIDVRVVGPTNQYPIEPNSDGSINVVSAGIDLDTAEKTFLVSYEGTVGTTETDMLLFVNPTASGVYVFLDSIVLTAVTGGRILWIRGYSGSTVTTNGTGLTELSVIKMTTPPTALCQAYSGPTIAARGSRNFVLTSGQYQLSAPLDLKPLSVLDETYTFLLTILASGVNSQFSIDMRWRELPK